MAPKQSYFLADVNMFHEAAQYYFTHYFHVRAQARQPVPFKDVPLIPTLLGSPLPQARQVGEALRDGTLLTAGFIRDSLTQQMGPLVAAGFPKGHTFHPDPGVHQQKLNQIGGMFVDALTNTPHVLTHSDFLGQQTQAAARRRPNLTATRSIPTDLRDLALREVRSRVERVAPENLRSSLLVDRQWWDRGLSTDIPAEVMTMDAASERAHIAVRDGTALPGRPTGTSSGKPLLRTMDWEDMVILAIAAQWVMQHGGSVTVGTGDIAMSQALSALALHADANDPSYLAAIGVQPYFHKGGAWVAGQPIPPRASLPTPTLKPQAPSVNAGFRPGRTIDSDSDAIRRIS